MHANSMDENNKSDNKTGDIQKRSSIRTYESDVAEAMQAKNTSLGSVFLAEQEKKFANPQYAPAKPSKTGLYVFLVLLFTSLSGGLLYFAWSAINKDDVSGILPTNNLQAVITDGELVIETKNLSAQELEAAMLGAVESDQELGDVSIFSFVVENASTTTILNSKQFVNTISWRMGGTLLRALSDKYSVGLYKQNTDQFFAVFTLTSYEGAFAGMLEWERYIYEDLKTFLEHDASESTSTSTPIFLFKDRVVENKDTRVLEKDGVPVLLYSFPDRRTLLISADETTFREILNRLSPERFTPN